MATQLDSISYIDNDFDIWKYDLTQTALIVDGVQCSLTCNSSKNDNTKIVQ